MKKLKSREVLFNRHQIFYIFNSFFGLIAILLDFSELGLIFVIGVLITVIYIGVILVNPLYYVFDEEKITIVHTCGIKEVIYYKDIRGVCEDFVFFRGGRPVLNYFEIYYPHEEKFPINSEICKSKKAKQLLEHYTNKVID